MWKLDKYSGKLFKYTFGDISRDCIYFVCLERDGDFLCVDKRYPVYGGKLPKIINFEVFPVFSCFELSNYPREYLEGD